MGSELESIGQEAPHHQTHLIGTCRRSSPGVDRPPIGIDPVRPTFDPVWWQVVCELDYVPQEYSGLIVAIGGLAA
jgi:hypothetical protein